MVAIFLSKLAGVLELVYRVDLGSAGETLASASLAARKPLLQAYVKWI